MEKPFSERLENWIDSKGPKNLDTLVEAFGDKSFAVIMFVFMLFPAIPLPTAAHVFEAIVILIAGQMVIGRRSLWLPKFLTKRVKLARAVKSKFMKKVIGRVKWLEIKAGPYGQGLFRTPAIDRVFGVIIILLCLTAFFAPPLSGLDTLPSLGVVLISLSILLENVFLLAAGLVVGASGVLLGFFFIEAILNLFIRLFS